MKTADFARRVNGAKIGDLGGKWGGGISFGRRYEHYLYVTHDFRYVFLILLYLEKISDATIESVADCKTTYSH